MYRILIVCFACVSIVFAQQYQDVVYLKDGSIVHGTIIEQVPNVSLKIQTKDQNVFVYKMDDILKMAKEPIIEPQQQNIGYQQQNGYQQNGSQQQNMGLSDFSNSRGYKSPGLAFLFSFIIPGVGQYYNGDIAKGVIQEVLCVGGWVVFSTLGTEVKSTYVNNGTLGGYYNYSEVTTIWVPIGLVLALGSELWSMIDAPISASNINKRNAQKISFNFGKTPKGAGAKLSYNF